MKKVVPVLIVLIAIIAVGGWIFWESLGSKYMPTSDNMDYAAEIGLGEGEYAITLNDELLAEDRGLEIDGNVYLSTDLVTKSLNSRFYWNADEQQMIYTTPTEMMIYKPDQKAYTVNSWDGEREDETDVPVVSQKDGKAYILGDFVKERTQMDYAVYNEPNRLAIRTRWGEVECVSIAKDTPLRYRGGIKSEVLRTAAEGETMVMLDSYEDWTNVSTADGYIGWVATADLEGNAVAQTLTAPEAPEENYTNIQKDYKIDMAWHQVMSEAANAGVASLLTTLPGVNTMSPTWYWLDDEEGTVRSIATQDYVDACHAADVEVWALFSNEFTAADGERIFDGAKTDTVLGSTEKRQSVIRQVIENVKQFGIDGINIDFEYISEAGADDYIEFIRELSIGCRAEGIVLSIDNYVPKYTSYYNRREQGIVADYVVIMGYDETTAGASAPGPVASIGFVREGITDTLAVVGKEKVINGLPLYTRVWSTAGDGTVSSFACGMDEAAGYLTNHGVTPQMREDVGLNYGSYTSDVDGNFYEIWLQDADAVTSEMELVRDYDLAGAAAWKIGFENSTQIWEIIRDHLQ